MPRLSPSTKTMIAERQRFHQKIIEHSDIYLKNNSGMNMKTTLEFGTMKEPEFYENCAFAWIAEPEKMIVAFDDDFHQELIQAYLDYYEITEDELIEAYSQDDYSYRGNAPTPLIDDYTLDDYEVTEFELLSITVSDNKICFDEIGMDTGSVGLVQIIEKLGWEVQCDNENNEDKYYPGIIYYVGSLENRRNL